MTALPQEERYTFADILESPDDQRMELIDGQIIMMAPPSRIHQQILTELTRQIANYLEGKRCRVYPAPFAVRLFEQEDNTPRDVDNAPEPDLTIVCDPSKLDDKGCKGVPDMVLEVLSPSTQRHDRLTKYNLYQRAGVKEYWIVDPESKTVQVSVLDGDRYRLLEVYTAQDVAKVNVLEACYVELAKVFRE